MYAQPESPVAVVTRAQLPSISATFTASSCLSTSSLPLSPDGADRTLRPLVVTRKSSRSSASSATTAAGSGFAGATDSDATTVLSDASSATVVGAMTPACSASAVRSGSSERKLGRTASAACTCRDASRWLPLLVITVPASTTALAVTSAPAAREMDFQRLCIAFDARGFMSSSCLPKESLWPAQSFPCCALSPPFEGFAHEPKMKGLLCIEPVAGDATYAGDTAVRCEPGGHHGK